MTQDYEAPAKSSLDIDALRTACAKALEDLGRPAVVLWQDLERGSKPRERLLWNSVTRAWSKRGPAYTPFVQVMAAEGYRYAAPPVETGRWTARHAGARFRTRWAFVREDRLRADGVEAARRSVADRCQDWAQRMALTAIPAKRPRKSDARKTSAANGQ